MVLRWLLHSMSSVEGGSSKLCIFNKKPQDLRIKMQLWLCTDLDLRKMKLTLLFALVLAMKSEDVDYGDDVMRLSRLMFRLKLISLNSRVVSLRPVV